MAAEQAGGETGAGCLLFERVPGLDTRDALDRMMGDRALYGSLLKTFREQFLDVSDRVESLAARGRWGDAEELVHSLKGTSGMLGAMRVFVCADRLDLLLKDARKAGVRPPGVEREMAGLRQEMQTLLNGLDALEKEG